MNWRQSNDLQDNQVWGRNLWYFAPEADSIWLNAKEFNRSVQEPGRGTSGHKGFKVNIPYTDSMDAKKAALLEYIEKTYLPEKISSGVELYSGGVDAPSFRQGFNTAKTMILNYLKEEL